MQTKRRGVSSLKIHKFVTGTGNAKKMRESAILDTMLLLEKQGKLENFRPSIVELSRISFNIWFEQLE